MSPLAWLRRLHLWFRRERATRDLEDELRLHQELRAASLQAEGVAHDDVRAAARRRFGNPVMIQEASRDIWGLGSLDDLRQDLRYAVRRLRQRPAFALAVIVVLAFGIGATTAMFSAVDAAMLRPLPFPQPGQLVTLPNVDVPFDAAGFPHGSKSALDVQDITAMHADFSHVAAWASGGLNLSDPDQPQRLKAGVVTADFFATVGIAPALGRSFAADEGKPGGPRVAVLSYGLWRQQFGGRAMLNRTILLNKKTYLVIGVMPRGFSFPMESDLWIPMSLPTTMETFEAFRGYLPSHVIARVARGVPVRTASARLLAQWQRLIGPTEQNSPDFRDTMAGMRQNGAAVLLQQSLVGDHHTALVLLLGATILLLLIACANVTNLLLSQAVTRHREIAIRQVLGARRHRVVRQLLTESVLLAVTGAALGMVLAALALGAMRTLLPADLAGVAPARLDLRVLAFATLVGLATGIAFGLWPALGAVDKDAAETIKANGGRGGTSGRASRLRFGLVAGELALTTLLLIGAGLMLRSFEHLMGMDRGLVTQQVGSLEVSFGRQADDSGLRRLARMHDILARLDATPGITSAGIVNDLPLGGVGGIGLSIVVEGAPTPKPADMQFARYLLASGSYFRTLGIRLLHGRTFTSSDDAHAPAVAIINETMAKQDWPGQDAVGRRFREGGFANTTVIGVVADVRESLDKDPGQQMYMPIDAQPPVNIAVVARGSVPPSVLLSRMTAAVRAVDPSQAVYHVRMMDDVLNTSVAPRRTNTLLISLFAGLALLLASLGVYAVVAHGLAQRAREFGIRTALGATGGDLLALVSGEMTWVIVPGIILGLAGAWALSHVASNLLYGVAVHDPMTFIAVPIVLLLPAIAATLIPSWRATRVNPAEVMRAD